MTLQEEIVDLAFSLFGEQDMQLEALCPAAEQTLLAHLRSGVSVDDCHDSFICAAALLAISMLESTYSGGLDSVDAGTLTLRFGQEGTRLSKIAYSLLQPWQDDGVAFLGVRT